MQKSDILQPPPPPGHNGVLTPFSCSTQSGSFLPPTPPRSTFNNTQAAESVAGLGGFGGMGGMGSFTGFNDSPDLTNNNVGGYYSPSPAAAAYNGSGGGYGLGGGMYGASPSQFPPTFPGSDLLHSSSNIYNEQQQLSRPTGPGQSASRAISSMLQQQRLQQFGSLHAPSMAAAAAAAGGLPPAYLASPLSRAPTASAQQMLQQQQQQIGRSFSIDVDPTAGFGGYGGAYGAGGMGRWGSGASRPGEYGGLDQGRIFGAVYDMKRLVVVLLAADRCVLAVLYCCPGWNQTEACGSVYVALMGGA